MKSYLVGTCGYDYTSVEYITLSEDVAKKLFDRLRKELIKRCTEMIEYMENDYNDTPDIKIKYINNYKKDIDQLSNMDYFNDDFEIRCDRPFIEVKDITNNDD
jgi:hypothetical protein